MFFGFAKRRAEQVAKQLTTTAEAREAYRRLIVKAAGTKLTAAEDEQLERACDILGIAPEVAEAERAELAHLADLKRKVAELPALKATGEKLKAERVEIERALESARAQASAKLDALALKSADTWRRIEALRAVEQEVDTLTARHHKTLGVADPIQQRQQRADADRRNVVLGYGGKSTMRRITGAQLAVLSTPRNTSSDAGRLDAIRELIPHRADGQSEAEFNRWVEVLNAAKAGKGITVVYASRPDDQYPDSTHRSALVAIDNLLNSKSPGEAAAALYCPSQYTTWADVDQLKAKLIEAAKAAHRYAFA